jgi:hypothetical protein
MHRLILPLDKEFDYVQIYWSCPTTGIYNYVRLSFRCVCEYRFRLSKECALVLY